MLFLGNKSGCGHFMLTLPQKSFDSLTGRILDITWLWTQNLRSPSISSSPHGTHTFAELQLASPDAWHWWINCSKPNRPVWHWGSFFQTEFQHTLTHSHTHTSVSFPILELLGIINVFFHLLPQEQAVRFAFQKKWLPKRLFNTRALHFNGKEESNTLSDLMAITSNDFLNEHNAHGRLVRLIPNS